MRKLLALFALLPTLAIPQSYTNFQNLQSGNVNFTATIRANGSACASGAAIVSGGGSVTCTAVVPTSQKGAANGVASLDGSGKVPTSQLPFSGLTYDGSWNASTNSPSLSDGTGTSGHFYITSVGGTQNLGSGSITFAVGDWALYNGTIWQKVPSSAAVSSVFGRTGAVTATAGDYTATQVTNTPAGGISATTAQAAIDELDTEKQAAASALTSWAALTRASGFDTFTQTPSSANLRGLLTDETGTGLAYFQGGALGTPSSATLTSATGLPWSTGLTGVPTTAAGYGITGGAKLDAYAGGDTPSAFTLGIVDSADAATWRAAIGAGTSSTSAANPTATLGLSAVNGSASTFMRSDGAPALSQAIAPTWTGQHSFEPASGVGITVKGQPSGKALQINGNTNYAWLSMVDAATAQDWSIISGLSAGNFVIRDQTAATNRLTIDQATGAISGIGSGLTSLNGSNISSGTLADARLSSNVPLKNAENVFSAALNTFRAVDISPDASSVLTVGRFSSGYQYGLIRPSTGAGLEFRDFAGTASVQMSSGRNWSFFAPGTGTAVSITGAASYKTLQLTGTTNYAWLSLVDGATSQDWGLLSGLSAGNFVIRDQTTATNRLTIDQATGAISGIGSGITDLNASNLASGTIPDARFPATLPAVSGASLTGVLKPSNNLSDLSSASTARTNLGLAAVAASGSATDISTGTLNNSRLPATINASTDVQVSGVSVCRSDGTNCPSGSGVSSITGTSNQVIASASTGAVTLSLPQSINTSASVQFGSFGVGAAASGTSGEIRATNNVTAYYSSDARLKTNVRRIPDALGKVSQIRGVTFDWTDGYIASHGGEDGYFMRRHDVGVIAQEVEAVLPEVVATREDGYKAVKYDRLVALLIESVKDLKAANDELYERVKQLEGRR